MYSIINRICWIISLIVSLIIVTAVSGRFEFELIFISGIVAAIFKMVVFPSNSIKKAIETQPENKLENNIQQERSKQINLEDVEKDKVNGLDDHDKKTDSTELKVNLIDHNDTRQKPEQDKLETEIKKEVSESKVVQYLEKTPSKQTLTKVKTPGFLATFFGDNILAKIGGILIFLGALFFLSIAFVNLGDFGRLIMGFLFGVGLVGLGIFLDRKGIKVESRVVMGVGFLVNYLAILSGRYLLGGTEGMYSEGECFALLIINTLVAIVGSLKYKSYELLVFSFIFAYLNPFLIGGSTSDPYLLSLYSVLISFGIYYILYKNISNKYRSILLNGAFILGNILILVAPYQDISGWMFKFLCGIIITVPSLYLLLKAGLISKLGRFITYGFIFIMLYLIYGGFAFEQSQSLLYIVYAFAVLSGIFLSYFSFKTALNHNNNMFIGFALIGLVVPLLGVGFELFEGNLILVSIVLLPLFFSILLVKYHDEIDRISRYVMIGSVGLFLLMFSFYLGVGSGIAGNELFVLTFTCVAYLLLNYYLTFKKGNERMYAIGTTIFTFMMYPIVDSLGSINNHIVGLVLLVSNLGLPFVNKGLINNDEKNIPLGLLSGILFIVVTYFSLGYEAIGATNLGVIFMILCAIYLACGYYIFGIEGKKVLKKSSHYNVSFISYSGICISLFTIAIALLFSGQEGVVTIIWLFEAMFLIYMYQHFDAKIFKIKGFVLYLIGIIKLILFVDIIWFGGYSNLFPLLICFALLMGFYVMYRKELTEKILSNLVFYGLHLLGLVTIFIGLVEILNPSGNLIILLLTLYLIVISLIYNKYENKPLIKLNQVVTGILLFIHLLFVIDGNISSSNLLLNLGIGQETINYLQTILLGILAYVLSYKRSKLLIIGFLGYLFVVSSYYVYDCFLDYFVLTIYWGIISFILMYIGISKGVVKYRTLGLYLLILVLSKILLFDIWNSIDSGMIKVFMLMFVGGGMIYLSALYEKKLGISLKDDLDLSNFEK